ncbi:MBOAT family O-acyltransferase [Merdimmobilis hominis]
MFADRLSCIKKLQWLFDKLRIKDIILIVFSLGFYMWSSFDNVFRLIFYIFVVYLLGLWIQTVKSKGYYFSIHQSQTSEKRIYFCLIPLIIAVSLITFCLIYFNYSNFLIDCWNKVFGDNIGAKSLVAPIGISFLTFSAISYLTDIYRGHATAGSFIDCTLYLSFFPKIISGPIVLWKDFQTQIKTRSLSLNANTDGLNRTMIGFAKKIILADSFGACLAQIPASNMDQITAFGTLILYMLQIYYDFSGYSDIAIGIAKLFGFEFKENFNFPYRSTSISEFWRRWHISLGTWFREYVYIPLGGSRAGQRNTLRNLAVVFALTGIWHGAGWNYILWGFINGAFAVTERVVQKKKFYIKTPKAVKYTVTMIVVMLFWQLFRFQEISDVVTVLGALFGATPANSIPYTWQYYFDARIILFAVIGILGATLLGSPKLITWYRKIAAAKIGYLLQELVLLALFVIAILFMINSTYSPFIYFQY